MRPHLSLTTAIAAACACVTPAIGQDDGAFRNVTVFGDSLSDPGNIPLTTGADFPPFPYAGNRFSNGPTWAEVLPGLLAVDGTTENFAHGGSFTGQLPTAPGLEPFLGPTTGNLNALQNPLDASFDPLLFGLDDTDILSQLGGYLASGPAIGPDDLFAVWGGANDYFFAANAVAADPANAEAIVEDAVRTSIENLATTAGGLAEAGARHIVVPNLPDLGATPSFSGDPLRAQLGSSISDGHNTLLNFTARTLADSYDANIYVVDIVSLTADTRANPAKYGVSNVTDPCFTGVSVCADPDSYAFWDGVHPTAAGHATIAAFVADTVLAPRTLAAQAQVGAAHTAAAQRQLTSLARAAQRTGQGRFLFADVSYDEDARPSERYAYGHDYDGYTLSAGMAGRPLPNVVAGGLVGFTQGDATLVDATGGFDFLSLGFGAFVGAEAGVFEGNASLSWSDEQYDSIRRATGVAGQIAQGDATGKSLGVTLEGLAHFGSQTLQVSPLARLRFADVTADPYVESGAAGLNQGVAARDLDSLDGEAGAEIAGQGGAVWWRLEGVLVDQLDEPGQIVESALVSVSSVPRTLVISGEEDAYARFEGAASFDLGGFSLELGATTTADRDQGDDWSAYGRLGRTF